jgi:hypothetical protein
MKILQVIPYFPPAYIFGGPVKKTHQISILARAMAALIDADVFVTPAFNGFPLLFLSARDWFKNENPL